MTVDRLALEDQPREELVVEARRLGVKRPEVMTRVELSDEILRLSTPNPVERKKVRGWLGVARDLLASVVEQGLNLPDAAALIRGDVRFEPLRSPQAPVATVTLAEIYGAQGHYARALSILDEVLDKEPDHEAARALRDRIARDRDQKRGDAPALPDEPAEEPPRVDEPDLPTLPPPPDPETLPPPPEDAEPETLPPPSDAEMDARTLFPPRPAAKVAEPALVLVRAEPSAVALYYEADAAAVTAGPLVVRVVEFRPRDAGAERVERNFPVAAESGTLTVSGIEPAAVVRAVLGAHAADGFTAVAVAAELARGGTSVLWAPYASDERAPLAARAAERLAAALS